MHDDDDGGTYRVRRFHFQEDHPDNRRVIATGLTLDQARAHCRRPDTSGGSAADGSQWFDGYEEE